MGADYCCPTMVDDVCKLICHQSVIKCNDNRTYLMYREERLDLHMGIRRQIRNTITRLNAKLLKRSRPLIASKKEVLVGQPGAPINHRLSAPIETTGTTVEL